MSRYTASLVCTFEGCNQRDLFACDTRKEQQQVYGRRATHRCTRHRKPEEVLSVDAVERTTTYTVGHLMYETVGQSRSIGQTWEGAHGAFAFGPGFKAWAKDFPIGTRLVVTARVEVPGADDLNPTEEAQAETIHSLAIRFTEQEAELARAREENAALKREILHLVGSASSVRSAQRVAQRVGEQEAELHRLREAARAVVRAAGPAIEIETGAMGTLGHAMHKLWALLGGEEGALWALLGGKEGDA